MKYNKQGHCIYYAKYHIVLATRYRRKILKWGVRGYLKWSVKSIERHYPEIKIIEANTDIDHMHLLVSIPPKISVSEVVRIIKCNTGKSLRKKFKFLDKVYYGRGGIWSIGYFVSTAGISEETIRRYVELQGREDQGQAELEF
jgi:putative transposase